MKVKIIGNGAWGNALYSVVRLNCTEVSILKREEKVSDCDVIILSMPTQSIRESLKYISFSGKTRIIVNTAKGIEKSTHLLPHQIVNSAFGDEIDYYTLIGPSFAQEVIKKMPTLVNLGYVKKNTNNQKIKKLFQTDFFRVRLTIGVEVLELSAAFKNIYAIACGLAQGLGYGLNTRVKLIVLAIEEMTNLYKDLHLKFDSDMTAGTMGDLILTCNSIKSRNFAFGTLLAKHSVDKSLSKVNSTVEGFHSLASLEHFNKKARVRLPLATFVSSIIQINNPEIVKKSFEKFVSLI